MQAKTTLSRRKFLGKTSMGLAAVGAVARSLALPGNPNTLAVQGGTPARSAPFPAWPNPWTNKSISRKGAIGTRIERVRLNRGPQLGNSGSVRLFLESNDGHGQPIEGDVGGPQGGLGRRGRTRRLVHDLDGAPCGPRHGDRNPPVSLINQKEFQLPSRCYKGLGEDRWGFTVGFYQLITGIEVLAQESQDPVASVGLARVQLSRVVEADWPG